MKHIRLFFAILVISITDVIAQNTPNEDHEIYSFSKINPIPFVCNVQQYFLDQLYYKDSLLISEGKTTIQFVIEKNGDLSNTKILKSLTPHIDSLLTQIINESPQWTAGQNLNPVRCKYTLPLDFRPMRKVSSDNFVYSKVDSLPQFKGDYSKYVKDSLRYPEMALSTGIEGTVIIGFIVEKDGSVSENCFLKRAGWGLEEEAIRFFQSMPHWIPAVKNGEHVRSYHKLTIRFNHPSH